MGEEPTVPGGVLDHGTQEEDGPETWEALAFPRMTRVDGETGDPSPTPSTYADHAPAVKKSVRIGVGRRQGEPEPWPMEARESEGCIRAKTSGNGVVPGPGRAKAARVDVSFRREPCPTHRRWETCHWEF